MKNVLLSVLFVGASCSAFAGDTNTAVAHILPLNVQLSSSMHFEEGFIPLHSFTNEVELSSELE